MTRQGLRPSQGSIPRFLKRNAVWSEDLGRVRLAAFSLCPDAVITPHGEWEEYAEDSGNSTVRERKAYAAWLRRIRRLMRAYPRCLAIAIDCHC